MLFLYCIIFRNVFQMMLLAPSQFFWFIHKRNCRPQLKHTHTAECIAYACLIVLSKAKNTNRLVLILYRVTISKQQAATAANAAVKICHKHSRWDQMWTFRRQDGFVGRLLEFVTASRLVMIVELCLIRGLCQIQFYKRRSIQKNSGGGKGGRRGACARAALCRWRHLEGAKI